MSSPKPWERAKTQLNSNAPEQIIAPSQPQSQPMLNLNRTQSLPNESNQAQFMQTVASGMGNNDVGNNLNEENKQLVNEGGAGLQSQSQTTANTSNSMMGSNPYSSSFSSPYGGGMYGGGSSYGMGGMGMGGMYGRGMYGGGMGMGMGGMYGGGMYGMNNGMGNSRSFLERMSAYVYQLCEIASMVEFNGQGLYAFFTLLKNLTTFLVKFGKDWGVWFVILVIEKSKAFKEWVKKLLHDFFIRKDLSKDELQTQISFLQKALKVILFFVIINLIRVLVNIAKNRKLRASALKSF